MKKHIISILMLLPVFTWGQQTDSTINYMPKVSGIIKAKWEYCFDDHTNRFDIRNSRLGIGGSLNPYVDYKLQIEYSNHGKFNFLDAYAVIKPLHNLDFYFGQFTVPFSEDYVISPSQNMFANRAFIAKFVNLTSRDIGARIDYVFSDKVPVTLQAGLYNGTGINNPEWQESPFVLGRLIYGTMKGFRASVKYYGGKVKSEEKEAKIANYGVDLRYATNRYKIEAEYAIKDSVDTDNALSAAYLQGSYTFPVKNNKFLKYIEPALRADAMAHNMFDNGIDVSRMTLGVNFGLDMKNMAAEIRLNYEHFWLHESKDAILQNIYFHNIFDRSDKGIFDKFSIEFLIKF